MQVNGPFAEYLVVDAEFGVGPIPAGWSLEEAAQLGVCPLTASQCLHQSLELPSPFEAIKRSYSQRAILIWGGVSSVGNFGLVRGLGADEGFDYRDEGVVGEIRAATGKALDIAVDTASEGKTAEQVTETIGNKGGKMATILPYQSPRPDVKVILSKVLDFVCFNVPNSVLIQPNGIAGVKDGLQYMQEGMVSGQTITYHISDTRELQVLD